MPGMLYYPFADAPRPVIQQAVLYWDSLSTVVAPGWEERMQPHMNAVRSFDFYRPIVPYEHYQPLSLGLISSQLTYALRSLDPRDLGIPLEAPTLDSEMLHAGKLHPYVVAELVDRGLVVHHPESPMRLYGSQLVIHMVVSILAAHIAAVNNRRHGDLGADSLHPHTDRLAAHRMNTDPLPRRRTTESWQIDIGPLLPVPRSDVSLHDLWEFRQRYDDERIRLMIGIQKLLQGLKAQHPRDAYELVAHELTEARRDLEGAAKSSKISLVYRQGLAVVVAFAAAIAGKTLGLPDGLEGPLGVVSGGAVNIATTAMRYQPTGAVRDANVYRYLHTTHAEFERSSV